MPSVFVLLAAALGLITSPARLDSPRPRVSERLALEAPEEIPARLWQDPLRAVREAREELQQGAVFPEAEALRADIKENLRRHEQENKRLHVLAVTVPGRNYSESQETRLRARYAALTGLASIGFFPSKGDRIGVIHSELEWEIQPTDGQEPEKRSVEADIPFEWFKPDQEATGGDTTEPIESHTILLLWLDESAISGQILHAAHALFHQIAPESATRTTEEGVDEHDRDRVAFDVVGPSNSNELEPYASSSQQGRVRARCSDTACPASASWLFSPWSTADFEDFEGEGKMDFGFGFAPMIGSDQQLCELLARELKLRGIDPREDGRVALISEWDTVYGRQLPATFRDELRKVFPPDEQEADEGKAEEMLLRITYLRGIDGRRPGKKSEPKSRSGEQDEKTLGRRLDYLSSDEIEWPEGESQYDYLRRIRRVLELIADEEGPVLAVGVTGSDVYDKILILRALRGSFPDVLFFTTDLDVRLLHPAEHPYTHNLIIASHYSLAPGVHMASPSGGDPAKSDEYRWKQWLENSIEIRTKYPLFRYSYQTALMLSMVSAVSGERPAQRETVSHPRIFEVGRNGPVLLNRQGRDGTAWPPWFLTLILVASLPAAIFLPLPGNGDDGSDPAVIESASTKEIGARAGRVLWLSAIYGLPFFILTFIMWLDSRSLQGEPLGLADGLSIWPSLYLLTLLVMLCAYFLKRIWDRFQKHLDQLQKEFLPDKRQSDQEFEEGCHDAAALWRSFRGTMSEDALRRRMARYAPLLVGATILMVHNFPRRPFRGAVTEWLDLTLLFLGLLGTGLVIILMLDITYFSYRLIRRLGELKTCWPKPAEPEEAGGKSAWARLDEWWDVSLIGRLTEFHDRYIYLPFLLLLVYGAAHHYIFDNWVYRPPELAEYLIAIALTWLPLIAVHLAASAARRDTLRRLEREHRDAVAEEGATAGVLKRAIDEIKALKTGAFAPLTQNPVLSTVLIPFGGIGGLVLLEFLLR